MVYLDPARSSQIDLSGPNVFENERERDRYQLKGFQCAMMNALLFVYGSLKHGGKLHHKLEALGARFLGPAKIQGKLFRIKGESWPGAFPTSSGSHIHGELYKMARPAENLRRLDVIEGCNQGLFIRELVNAWLGNRRVRAWVYLYNRAERKGSRIASGNFSTE